MADVKVKVAGHRCERCGHEWIPRGPRLENRKPGQSKRPKMCPSCKSTYWDVPKPQGGAPA